MGTFPQLSWILQPGLDFNLVLFRECQRLVALLQIVPLFRSSFPSKHVRTWIVSMYNHSTRKKWLAGNSGQFITILRFVPSVSFKFHPLPTKAHPQRTIQCAVMSSYLFPTWKVTVPFTSFHFLESFAYCVPLSASLRTGFSQNENEISWLNHQYCMKELPYSDFLQSSVI